MALPQKDKEVKDITFPSVFLLCFVFQCICAYYYFYLLISFVVTIVITIVLSIVVVVI